MLTTAIIVFAALVSLTALVMQHRWKDVGRLRKAALYLGVMSISAQAALGIWKGCAASSLVRQVANVNARTDYLEVAEEQTSSKVSEPRLRIEWMPTVRTRTGLKVSATLIPSNDMPLGPIKIRAEIRDSGRARLLEVEPPSAANILTTVSDDGKHAELTFTPTSPGPQVIDLVLTHEAEVGISGDHGLGYSTQRVAP